MVPDWVMLASALGAAGGAVFAGVAVVLGLRQEKRRATFEHLREIDRRLVPVWTLDLQQTTQAIRQAYSDGGRLEVNDADYLSLLNALELLAMEMEQGVVHAGIAEDYLRSLCSKDLVDSDLIKTMQGPFDDPKIYQHVLAYVTHFENLQQGAHVTLQENDPDPKPPPPPPRPSPSPPRRSPPRPGGQPGEKTFPPPPPRKPQPKPPKG